MLYNTFTLKLIISAVYTHTTEQIVQNQNKLCITSMPRINYLQTQTRAFMRELL